MIPAAFGDTFGIVTTNAPDDETHELICNAVLNDSGYFLGADTLLLVTSADAQDNGDVHWTVHRCEYAGRA